ncbi:hypothetical protein AVEN_133791-1 [Araneus ventricosus]|uniref:Uncharacterized protein n=1 Tax=Araneus ventricosus TaxID=182803 RepID=A0A4Y2L3C1_ARAVE|nr:hypothetical protein AVEN_133791-1 [Araneus ventricosus]
MAHPHRQSIIRHQSAGGASAKNVLRRNEIGIKGIGASSARTQIGIGVSFSIRIYLSQSSALRRRTFRIINSGRWNISIEIQICSQIGQVNFHQDMKRWKDDDMKGWNINIKPHITSPLERDHSTAILPEEKLKVFLREEKRCRGLALHFS